MQAREANREMDGGEWAWLLVFHIMQGQIYGSGNPETGKPVEG